ncbi:MAG: acylphosphatase [Anaerolineales bacterium]|nr:MAG: acylphosphatase [Anaerolineales bacterium]
MPDEDFQQLHVSLEGRVQGVGFRYFVYDHAQAMGLSGWVRNRRDGSVEVHAEGRRASLDKFLSELRRGPRSSNVLGIHPTWKPATGEYSDFQILPTTS